ncbi:MAG TPA: hypothetical protein VGO50_02580 [Pyrinomonadaceae bacterium]|jgi:hypothetical protein|nr:hypothetical protein [Pyrinomonadaceae bacterium]
MTDNLIYPRPEARPVPYDKNHDRAKKALDFIIRILAGALESIPEGEKNNDGIDMNRASRIVFVSGEPGTGKSTLYLTLRKMISSEKEYGDEYENPNLLTKLKSIRWLDTLDLEVAGEEGENLLAGVLIRLIEELTGENSTSSTSISSPCEDAIKDLEDLATDIGIAWEGNLQARAAALDPDTYSEEVMRTQRARLGVNKRLNDALDKLSEKDCFDCGKQTLFVLPVDDFYLKPAASLQLLRLLRMISIPRLFFLVMGDIKTVEALFMEKSLADWTAVAGSRLFHNESERLNEALRRARELRGRYLRKLLPPAQRHVIEPMDWFEALEFELFYAHIKEDENKKANESTPLEELMKVVKLDDPVLESEKSEKAVNQEDNIHKQVNTNPVADTKIDNCIPENILSFLISPAISGEEKKEKERKRQESNKAKEKVRESPGERALKKQRSAYTALQILDATPREVLDFGAMLNEVQKKRDRFVANKEKVRSDEKVPQLLVSIMEMTDLAREEQNFLDERQQKILEGVIPTRLYSPEELILNMDKLHLEPLKQTWEVKSKDRLWIRKHHSWKLSAIETSEKGLDGRRKEKELEKDPYAKLPPRPAAWFILLHDLAYLWNPLSITKNLVEKFCKELNEWEFSGDAAKLTEHGKSWKKDAIHRFLNLFEMYVHKPNKALNEKEKGEEEGRSLIHDPTEYFPGWIVVKKKNYGYKHLPVPEFFTFRDFDRFLFIWNMGLKWLGEEKEIEKFLFLWRLSGKVIFLDEKEKWFEDFSKGSDKWFGDFFAENPKGKDFHEYFNSFRKEKRQIECQYKERENEQMEKWEGQMHKYQGIISDNKEDECLPRV